MTKEKLSKENLIEVIGGVDFTNLTTTPITSSDDTCTHNTYGCCWNTPAPLTSGVEQVINPIGN